MLTTARIEHILAQLPRLRIAVFGDLFLDRYLDLNAGLTEPSIETGLDAYQVVGVRSYPGAAGTVINNLVALGVGAVVPVAVIGDDGEGFELRQALDRLGVTTPADRIITVADRRTPTYCKPMLHRPGEPPRELNRLDFKNRTPLPADVESRLLDALRAVWPRVDALIVVDQVSEPDCGVVTERARAVLAELGDAHAEKLILADSRERIGLFRSVSTKPNRSELLRAFAAESVEEAIVQLARTSCRPVFCTAGERGIYVCDGSTPTGELILAPAFPVHGPIDIVGAGDSTSAGIACALASGASLTEAAAFGNLIASITIQQIGVTGVASPEQVRERWREVNQVGRHTPC